MYAHMGMKVEEWEDGRVNIGIAVCPTKPTAIIAPIAATEHQTNDMLMSHSGNFVVVPESAFIIRTPEHYQSQGGISVAYARHTSRPSNFVIMLNPQDQGYQNRKTKQDNLSHTHSNSIAVREKMESIERNEKEVIDTSEKSDSIIVSKNMEEKVENSADKSSSEPSVEKESTSNCRERNNLTTPQNSDQDPGESVETATTEVKATGSPEKEASLIPVKRSGDMKRVSWVEDTENFEDKKGSCKNSKENKKEGNSNITRKSNGNSSSRNSPTKKQQGFSSEDVRSIASEAYTKGDKRSGDRSRIPLIASSAGDYPTSSCEFYRRQMLRECMYNPSTLADNWYGYTSIQKYAGQKVVKKIAAEQKRLEEDISNRRKTEIWILGNETDDFILSPCTAPLRKRTTRLKPMQIVQ